MIPNLLTINGIDLEGLGYSLSSYDGLRALPARRMGQAEVPGRTGVIPSLAMNTHEPAEVALNLWIADHTVCEETARAAGFHTILDMLLHLIAPLDRLLDVRLALGDGSVRQAYARVLDAVTPEITEIWSAEFVVLLQLPETFWQDLEPQVFSGPASADAPHTLRVDTLTGSTAPIEDALFLVHGPAASGVTLTCPDTGGWISLHRPLAVGEVWRVDSAKWLSQVGPIGMGFDGPADTDVIAHTEFAGSGARLLSLQPVVKMPPDYVPGDTYPADSAAHRVVDVTLSGGGFSSATRVQIRARRKFL